MTSIICGFGRRAFRQSLGGSFKGVRKSFGDVAPTLLHLMGLPIPAAMDGEVLVE
ncbi:MAG: hypothetical protein ACFCUI_03520 [Bernardetiaceae bacterium]